MFVAWASIKSNKNLKIPFLLCSNWSLTFYVTFLAVMLASTQACEWHDLWWSLCTLYVLWSRRCVWWHHRSMCGKCPCRKQWTWPTSTQYTCATELVTSDTWNNGEEKSQWVTEEVFMLRLRIPSHQDMVSLTVKERKHFLYHIGSML